jgi:hypothetical protein
VPGIQPQHCRDHRRHGERQGQQPPRPPRAIHPPQALNSPSPAHNWASTSTAARNRPEPFGIRPGSDQLLAERGVAVDHVTIYRWVQRFTLEFIEAARPCRHAPGDRWFVDETYLKVAGKWACLPGGR